MQSFVHRTRRCLVAMIALTAAGTLVAQTTPGGVLTLAAGHDSRISLRADSFDAGDRLKLPGDEQVLLRRANAIVVKFKNRGDAKARGAAFGRLAGAVGGLAGSKVTSEHGNRHTLVELPVEVREKAAFAALLAQARAHADVETADPVFVDGASSLELLCLPEIIVAPKPGVAMADLVGPGAGGVRLLTCTADQYIVSLPGAAAEVIFAEANRLAADPRVWWAHPNFTCEVKKAQVPAPNDEHFGLQWHLENTGQVGTGTIGGTAGADIKALFAWQYATGSHPRTVAVLDDGVQLNHPDLQNIRAINSADLGGDEDGNGFVNDLNGWDFAGVPSTFTENSDPSNKGNLDTHGTKVAGVAVAEVGNGMGVAGIGRGQRVLPVKVIYHDQQGAVVTNYSSTAGIASSIRYAGGSSRNGLTTWPGADVINMSFLTVRDPAIESAIDWATRFGRGGHGCAVVAASGNAATAQPAFHFYEPVKFTLPGPGNVLVQGALRWQYEKDTAGIANDDAVWLDSVAIERDLGGGNWTPVVTEDFTGTTFPPTTNGGWTRGVGVNGWSRSTQANRTVGGTGGSAKSGAIGDNGQSWLQWNLAVSLSPGSYRISYQTFASCAAGDAMKFYLGNELASVDQGHAGVEYPARYRNVIGVGATDAKDVRSGYSQFGAELDLVAPGAAGDLANPLIETSGVGSAYVADAGTSFASPLVAGTAALMLSEAADRGFDLTADEVGLLLRASADKVGSVTYTGGEGTGGGFHVEYGYGRLNAAVAAQYVHFSRPELAGWTGIDITPPSIAGSSRRFEEIGMRSLRTAEFGFGSLQDQCTFVYQDISGNFQIVARINSIGGTAADAMTGLMIREGTGADARHATVGLTGDGKATFVKRTTAGNASSTTNVNSISPPYWVRLIRTSNSNTVTAARSVNGTTWTTSGTISLPAGATYQIGLVATSGSTAAALATGTLTNVEVLGPGIITTYAGNGFQSSTGDGGPATSGSMARPGGMAFVLSGDPYVNAGDLYVAETMGNRIRKINTAGIISTPIGTGTAGFADGPAASAQFSSPADVAFDRNNRLYIADSSNHRIRRWDPSTGQVTTIAGTGTAGFSGDGGSALSAQLNYPHGVCVDASGRVYIAERSPNGAGRIRRIDLNGNITTFAGGATPGLRGDGLLATQAWLIDPHDVVVDESDNVYIADTYDYRVRRVDGATGIITTAAGNGNLTFSGDGGAATVAGVGYVPGVAVAETGDVYLTSETVGPVASRVRKIDAMTGKISTVAGKAASGFSGDGGLATSATLNLGQQESQVVVHPTGAFYISDTFNFRIRKVR